MASTLDFTRPGRFLSLEQMQQYERDGFLVVRNLVPKENLESYR